MNRLSRLLLIVVVLAAVLAIGAGDAWAQQSASWPAYPLPGKDFRGPGYYLSWIKILSCWLVFLAWVWTTDWVSRDVVELKLDYLRWNPIVFGCFMASFALMWVVPWFWLGFPLLVIAYVAPLTTYILFRNSKVTNDQRVLTKEHLRWWAAQHLNRLGFKIEAEAPDPHTQGPPLRVAARGGPDDRTNAARLLAARQSPGLRDAREILAEAVTCRASTIMLDFTQQGVAVRYMVDGVWIPREAKERESADPALEALKLLCGLNAQDRRSRQEGRFGVDYAVLKPDVFKRMDAAREEYRKKLAVDVAKELASPEIDAATLQLQVKTTVEERVRAKFASRIGPWTPMRESDLAKIKYVDRLNPQLSLQPITAMVTLVSQGTTAGERVLLQFEEQKIRFHTLDELGMRPKMQEQLKELLGRPAGLALFAALPAGGLRSTSNIVLRTLDRLLREFVSVEEETNRYEEIENVPATTYKAADGQSPADVLPKLLRAEPHVLVVRDLVNAQTIELLCDAVADGRMAIGTVRAKDCAEALLRVMALGAPQAKYAAAVTGVLGQRLVRKLCETCKEPYVPAPQILQQLGIPEGRIQAFYRPPQQREEVCEQCGGVGYVGRTAIFELLVVDDNIRQILATAPKLDLLRQAARKAGMRNLQEEGILLVAKGTTSLQELMRILKQ